MEIGNNLRLTCKGLLRESLSKKKNIPSLVNICVNKLRTIRNTITCLEEKNISKNLIYLIFKGSTCHELLAAEKNNSGIHNMFGSDTGQIWDALWETAVKVRYSNNEHILSKKENNENYREFFIRNQEDAEKKFKTHILKRSKSIGVSKVKRTPNIESNKGNRRTLSLHNGSNSGKNSTSSKRSINILENTPIFDLHNPLFKPRNSKTTALNNRSNKSSNPILREYFEQKSKYKSINRLSSSVNSRISSLSSSSANTTTTSVKFNRKPEVTFKLD
ncbi:uncharacterized protein cubi_01686 [Cryptosporidium ubiquitum]|uniref:Uncharacterized protein n=1 Tax=Cryptosporidium ubiquitum TaxID=857276 RepID=A0A1J4MES6_9CRYT|nr:uncharacterized protein cubi_01686 [Cryptosporidium ubiquitum]OII72736.1 hypothetical protein cubi_01686 [Cryptosporidium ubiquitum]